LTASAPVSTAAAQDFHWRGRLTSGQTIEVKGVNGDISASSSSSGDVEVTATKTARRSNPAEVRIEVVPGPNGMTICAVYPSVADREPNRCAPGEGRMNTRENDTQVHFEVRVPMGVALAARTVNGEVQADSLQSDVEAHTVNGSIRVATTMAAEAATVNGSVTVTMGRLDAHNGARFRTVNGEITLNLPPVVDADLRADTLNGSVRSDYRITMQGSFSPRRLRGTIGNGGPELNVSTVNGSITLRNAQ
jgi:cytoskeletal protein CcmA (bactofilin family)